MSSILNFFSWNSTAAPQPIVTEPANSTVVAPTPAESSDDAFVLIDTPMVETPSNGSTPSHTRTSSESWSPIDAEPLKLASPISAVSSARSCRLYGAAHKPPRLHPSSILTTIPGSPTATASAGTKRSFAEILKSSTPTTTTDSPTTRLAYAQSAQLSVAEQLLAKIEQLESLQSRGSNFIDAPMTDDIQEALDSIQYSSPPLKPTVPLTREQTRLYDQQTEWTLNVDEPNSKRAKRAASPTVTILSKADTQAKEAKKKGKAKPIARKETKAIHRARISKLEADSAM